MKTCIVLGKGKLACDVAASLTPYGGGYKLVGIVPVLPSPRWTEDFALYSETILKTRSYPDHEQIPNVDLVVSVQYDKILTSEFLQRHGRCINIHFSPLPKYRGMRPVNWALRNKETEHGVTIHEIDEGIDTGDIIGQTCFSIFPQWQEVEDVYAQCVKHARVLWRSALPILDKIEGDPQDWYIEEPGYYSKHDIAKLGDRKGWRR